MINDLDIVQWAYLLDPAFQIVNTAGKPLTDGWIEVYIHGTRNKYYCAADFDGTLHPFKIPLDSLGANIVLASPDFAYDIYIYNKFGSLVMSRYNVVAGKGGGGSGDIPSDTESEHWLGQNGATQPLYAGDTEQVLALPSDPDYQGDFVDHIEFGTINPESDTDEYPKYMYLKPGLYLVNCVIRFQQQPWTAVNRLDETLVYTGNGDGDEDVAWQLDETGPLTDGDCRHCLKLTFIRKVLDEGETSPVDCSNVLYFAPSPKVDWKDAYIQTLQIVKLNAGGGAGNSYYPGDGISIDNDVISVTGMQPASAMSDYVTINVFNEFVENVTGDINILQNEIDAVSAAVSGGVAPEYEAGYGIIIEGNEISVDPSVVPSGSVSQEEFNAVTGDIINQITNVTGDVTEITNIVNNVTGDVTNLTEVVNNVTGDVTNITEIVEGVTGDVTNIITEISNVTGDVHNLTEIVEGVTGDVTNITNIVEGVTGNISDLQGDITNITNVVNNVTGDVNNLTEIIEGVTGDVTNITEVVNNVTGDVSNLTEIVEGVTGDIEQLNIDIQTVSAAIPEPQVNADWAATGGVAEILNKPEEVNLVAGENITITESGSDIIISSQGGTVTGDYVTQAELDTAISAATGLIPDVSNLASKDEVQAVADDVQIVSAAIPDVSNFATQSDVQTVADDLQIVSAAIPDISDLATKDEVNTVAEFLEQDIQTVSAAIPDVSELATKNELDTAISAATGMIPDVSNLATKNDVQVVADDVQIVSAAIPDVSNLATKTDVENVEADIQIVSAAIPDTSDFATKDEVQTIAEDLQTVSAAIPDSSTFATEAELQIVSAAIPDVSNFATEAELQAVSAAIPDVAQADWAATGGPSEILNKPEEVNLIPGSNITIVDTAEGVIISSTGGGSGDITKDEVAAVSGQLEEEIQIVSAAIPDISNLATEADLQIVSAAIPDISGLATQQDLESVSADILAVSAEIGDVETLLANL